MIVVLGALNKLDAPGGVSHSNQFVVDGSREFGGVGGENSDAKPHFLAYLAEPNSQNAPAHSASAEKQGLP